MVSTVGQSFCIMFESMERHSLALGVIGVGLASAMYIQNIRNQVYLYEERMKIQEDLYEKRMKAQVERTKALVETAKRETTERFLMYGYAEEFQRFQQKLGMRPREQPEASTSDKST